MKTYSVAWVNDHDHVRLAVLGLSTVDNLGIAALDLDVESWLSGLFGSNWDEARVELTAWSASSSGGVASSNGMVLIHESESNSVAWVGSNFLRIEDQLLVTTNLDVDNGGKSQTGLKKERNGVCGEMHFGDDVVLAVKAEV